MQSTTEHDDVDDVDETIGTIYVRAGDTAGGPARVPTVGVPTLPMPDRLTQPLTSRSLMSSVRGYFYTAYNSDPRFKQHMASVGNDDSQTKNRMFDRHIATMIIQKLASEARDQMTAQAPNGHIYKCLVSIMRGLNLGLKIRRQQYRQLTHQQQAAE